MRRVTIAEPIRGTPLARSLEDPRALLESPEASWVKDHRRTAVARVRVEGREVFVKRFKPYSWYRRLEAWLRSSPARLSWNNARRLAGFGFAIPPPLAVVENGRDSYFVTEAVNDAEPAADFWLREADRLAPAERRRILRSGARTLRRFHDSGLYSRDTNANNFLIRRRSSGEPEFVFLDLENVRHLGFVGRRRRVKNLVQLYRFFRGRIDSRSILRFLLCYLGREGGTDRLELAERADLRAWLSDLSRLDRRKEREYRARSKRGRFTVRLV